MAQFWRRRRGSAAKAPASSPDTLEGLRRSLGGTLPDWVATRQTTLVDARRPDEPVVRPEVLAARAAAARERPAEPPSWLGELPAGAQHWSGGRLRSDLAVLVREAPDRRVHARGWLARVVDAIVPDDAAAAAALPAVPAPPVPAVAPPAPPPPVVVVAPAAPPPPVAVVAPAPVPVTPAAPRAPRAAGPNVVRRLIAWIAAEVRSEEERRRAAEVAARIEILESLKRMSAEGFAQLVSDLFRRDRYVTYLVPPEPATPVDLWAERGGDRVGVQHRHRDRALVGVDLLYEFAAGVTAQHLVGGWMFTTGRFTDEAEAAAPDYGMVLVDGPLLADLVVEATVDEWRHGHPVRWLTRRVGRLLGL